MSEAAVRAALARLRAAGRNLRGRPPEERLDALARTLDAWSEPDSPWLEGLAAALPDATGFHPDTAREGLRRGLAPLRGSALRALVERELGGATTLSGRGATLVLPFDVTAVILAGAVPPSTFVSLLAPLALGSPVLVKTARHDPCTAGWVRDSLAEQDAGLGACVEVVGFPSRDRGALGALLDTECVVASGSDATIASIAARRGAGGRFVPYGHRISVAVLGPEATRPPALDATAAGLALDIALWDQLGCLSPVAVYVADDEAATDRVAEALAGALARAERAWPRGRVDPRAAAAFAQEREEAEFRAAVAGSGHVLAGEKSAWAVVREGDAAPRPAPLHRFVRVHPIGSPEGPAPADALARALGPLARHLAGVALAGFGAATDRLARRLAELGASRICRPGELQTPPLAWHHDGLGVLWPLARFADVEPLGDAT